MKKSTTTFPAGTHEAVRRRFELDQGSEFIVEFCGSATECKEWLEDQGDSDFFVRAVRLSAAQKAAIARQSARAALLASFGVTK